jgi:hypothetical protein
MAMTRRNFIETGIGAVAALSVTQGVSRAQSPTAHSGIIVVGVDGAGLTVPYLDDYLSVGATVWQYSETTIDFDRFASIYSFVEANSSKITLAKSYSDILAAKRAGKVAMVVGVQDMWPLEWQWVWTWPANAGPNDWTFLSITIWGSGSAISPISSPLRLAVAYLTRRRL